MELAYLLPHLEQSSLEIRGDDDRLIIARSTSSSNNLTVNQKIYFHISGTFIYFY